MVVDVLGKICLHCQIGIYQEINIHEDIACNHCGRASERYLYSEKSAIYNNAYEKGVKEGVKQAKEEILDSLDHFVSNMKIGD